MSTGPRSAPQSEAKQSQPGSAWDKVSRIYSDYEARSHAALDASRMRAGDVLRPAIEAVIAAPRALATVLREAIDNSTKRVETAANNAASTLTGAAAEMQQAAVEQRQAAEAQFRADHAKALATLADRLAASTDAAVTADRRLRGMRAYGLASLAFLGTFGAGMLTEHWREAATATLASADSLERLQQQANATTAQLSAGQTAMAQSAQQILVASAAAAPALSLLTAMSQLPPAELEAAQTVIAELSGASDPRRSTAIVALREAMRLTPARRREAMEFVSIEDAGIRANLIEIGKQAAARGTVGWFTGETPFKGCLANGPALPTAQNTRLQTCLVQLPPGWPVQPDNGLRRFYLGNGS